MVMTLMQFRDHIAGCWCVGLFSLASYRFGPGAATERHPSR